MSPSIRQTVPALLALLALGSGCGPGGLACTLVGCSSGLRLNIVDSYGSPAEGTRGTVTVDGEEYAFDCAGTDSELLCEAGFLFLPIEGGEVATYDISSPDGGESAAGELTLEFESFAPNGPGCDPVCFNDEHTISLERPIGD